jgi:hypothetical protein
MVHVNVHTSFMDFVVYLDMYSDNNIFKRVKASLATLFFQEIFNYLRKINLFFLEK